MFQALLLDAFPDSMDHGANMDPPPPPTHTHTLGPVGPRWAPCRPHEPYYQGWVVWSHVLITCPKLIAPLLAKLL